MDYKLDNLEYQVIVVIQDEEQALQDGWSKTPPEVSSNHARKVITVSRAPLRFTKSVRSLSNLLKPI